MEVVVENLTGTLFYVQVGNDATVGDLKKEIEAHHNLPSRRLILILDSQSHPCPVPVNLIQEHERASLVDCGVHHGSHIYLFFNPLDDDSSVHNHFLSTWPDLLLGY